MVIEPNYILALVLVMISGGWAISAKSECERRFDIVLLYDTLLYNLITSIGVIAFVISLTINWINEGFLSTMCYIGIISVVSVVNGRIISPILVLVFGYQGIGAILPPIAYIISIVYLFVVQFS